MIKAIAVATTNAKAKRERGARLPLNEGYTPARTAGHACALRVARGRVGQGDVTESRSCSASEMPSLSNISRTSGSTSSRLVGAEPSTFGAAE